MPRINTTISTATDKWLTQHAKQQGTTKSQIIMVALEIYKYRKEYELKALTSIIDHQQKENKTQD